MQEIVLDQLVRLANQDRTTAARAVAERAAEPRLYRLRAVRRQRRQELVQIASAHPATVPAGTDITPPTNKTSSGPHRSPEPA